MGIKFNHVLKEVCKGVVLSLASGNTLLIETSWNLAVSVFSHGGGQGLGTKRH